MIEVIFMAAAAVFLTARYFFTKADVRMEAEAQLDRLTDPSALCSSHQTAREEQRRTLTAILAHGSVNVHLAAVKRVE